MMVKRSKEERPHADASERQHGTAYIFFDMQDTTQLPAILEPWFLAFNARLTARPAMNGQDLAKVAPGIEAAVKT